MGQASARHVSLLARRLDSDSSELWNAGGLALLRNQFTLVNTSLSNNVGFFGGGVFVGANLSTGTSLSNLLYINNTAILGAVCL